MLKDIKKLLKFLCGNQMNVLRHTISVAGRFFLIYYQALVHDVKGIFVYLKYRKVHARERDLEQDNSVILSEFLATDFDEANVRISFYGAARYKNNPNCHLEVFFESLIKNCSDLTQIEVLLAVDPDDKYHFLNLKKRYSKYFRLLIFVVERRLGYENLHLYYKLLYPHLAKNTRMIGVCTSDCVITLPNFDKALLAVDALYADNVYFIHTRDTKRHLYLGDVAKDIQLLYWILQAKEPASYFPIMSKKVLDIAYEYAKEHDKDNSWSPFANSWTIDCYIDVISCYVKRLGMDRIHFMDMIEMSKTIMAPHQRRDPITGFSANDRAFIKMLNNEALEYLDGLSKAIVNFINVNSSVVCG